MSSPGQGPPIKELIEHGLDALDGETDPKRAAIILASTGLLVELQTAPPEPTSEEHRAQQG